jgi:acyl carrier protein
LGLELVEIAMDAEETFGIAIPDSRISEIRTVGEFRDCIVEILDQNIDEESLAPTVFERLRNAMTSVGGIAPGSIESGARLSTIFPFGGRKNAWRRLGESLGLSLPPLELPRWLRTIGILIAVPLGWMCGVLAIFGLDLPKSGFLAAISAILGLVLGVLAIVMFWLIGRWLTSPLAACWPRGLGTVGDLSRAILQMHYGRVVKREHPFSREDVWCILQEIVAGVLGVDPQRVTPEARFVEDLGVG